MSANINIPLSVQIAEVERELAMRERVYPRFVASGKLAPPKATEYMRNMRAVLATLQSIPQPQPRATKGNPNG